MNILGIILLILSIFIYFRIYNDTNEYLQTIRADFSYEDFYANSTISEKINKYNLLSHFSKDQLYKVVISIVKFIIYLNFVIKTLTVFGLDVFVVLYLKGI